MNRRFSRLIDRIQFFGLLAGVIVIPLVFFIGRQNTLLFNFLQLLGFSAENIAQGNQNIVLFKPLFIQLLVYFLFGLWFVDSLEKNRFKLPSTPLNGLMVSWLWWLILTVFLVSPFWYYSAEEIGRYLAMILMFFLIQKVISSKTRFKWIMWVLFAVSIVVTILGLLQFFGNPIYDWGRSNAPVVSTFGNKNFFAGFLLLSIPVVAGYMFATRKLVIKVILFLLGAAELYILLGTGTRTGFLGFLVGLIIFLILLVRFIVIGAKTKVPVSWLLLAGLILILIFVAVYYASPAGLISRLGNAVDLQQGTGRVRWIMWTGSTRAALAKPLTGHGHGVFQLVFPNYRSTMYHRFRVSHNTRHSHNEFLEVIMETGLIGLTFFLLIMVSFSVVLYRFLSRCTDKFYLWVTIGFASSIFASLAQNFASVNFRWMSSTFTFWLIFSLAIAVTRLGYSKPTEENNPIGTKEISNPRSLFPDLSWKTFIHCLLLIVYVFCTYQFYSLVKADFYLKKMNALIRMAESKRGGVTWQTAQKAGRKAVSYNPFNLSANYKLGYVYLGQQKYGKARERYDRLTDLAPNYAQIHNNIALIHKNLGHSYRSLLHFEWATRLEDNLRNHMNLIRRHSRKNLTGRSFYHALYIPRIAWENIHDQTHRLISGGFEAHSFRGYKRRSKVMKKAQRVRKNALRFLNSRWQGKKSVKELLDLWMVLRQPAGRNTFRFMRQFHQKKGSPSPIVVLGMVEQLKKSGGRRAMAFRQQYMQMVRKWVKNERKKPLWRLVYGHLLAQSGKNKQARKLIRPYVKKWKETPRLSQAVQYITRVSGKQEKNGSSSKKVKFK